MGAEGVDEVDIRPLVQPPEQGRVVKKPQAVPSNVGQLALGGYPVHCAADHPQTGTGAHLPPLLQQQLHPQADAQHRLLLTLGQHMLVQPSAPQPVRRVREGPHSRQDNGVSPFQLRQVGGDAAAAAEIAQGVGHTLQIAHPVVHDGNCAHHSTPLVEVTPVPVI